MKTILKLTVVVVTVLLVVTSAAQAGENCRLKTMEGTYAISERGSSLILDFNPPPPPFPSLHWSGAVATFGHVGMITFGPDGEGSGFHWIFLGTLDLGADKVDPIPLQANITEMNEDCTGMIRYSWNLPGIPNVSVEDVSVVERIIVLDNGREFRSIPTATNKSGVPTLGFIGSGQRITEACGSQTAQGTYLFTGEGILPRETLLADYVMVLMDVAQNGDYTGTMYEKLGTRHPEVSVSGTISVNSNCSFSGRLVVPAVTADFTFKGVFVDEGKRGYVLLLYNINKPPDQQGVKYSFAEITRVRQ